MFSVILASHRTARLLSRAAPPCLIIGGVARLRRRAVLCDARMTESECIHVRIGFCLRYEFPKRTRL
ncbi:hypothetical protein Y032_0010g942 [Ancylostoma ceylanicum]|uniref:Uncharacterized protein n=1 Tax=Ancylostoma ceylanicum TaxID=53326 RepID=A0A016VIZ9_9BILA|nr:hypothetical protein Y032_0010g942 [Ancylostoma ceylanicum]